MNSHASNPLIKPEMVQPSRQGYRAKGAFNTGAVEHNGEIVLLLRVAEDCMHLEEPGKVIKRGEKPLVYPEMNYEKDSFSPMLFSPMVLWQRMMEVSFFIMEPVMKPPV